MKLAAGTIFLLVVSLGFAVGDDSRTNLPLETKIDILNVDGIRANTITDLSGKKVNDLQSRL